MAKGPSPTCKREFKKDARFISRETPIKCRRARKIQRKSHNFFNSLRSVLVLFPLFCLVVRERFFFLLCRSHIRIIQTLRCSAQRAATARHSAPSDFCICPQQWDKCSRCQDEVERIKMCQWNSELEGFRGDSVRVCSFVCGPEWPELIRSSLLRMCSRCFWVHLLVAGSRVRSKSFANARCHGFARDDPFGLIAAWGAKWNDLSRFRCPMPTDSVQTHFLLFTENEQSENWKQFPSLELNRLFYMKIRK